MPNPVRSLRRKDRLSSKQRAYVKKIKGAGLKPLVYRRKSSKTRISVHNPFLDIQRHAKTPKFRPILARRYPHAYDTKGQRRVSERIGTKLSKTKKVNKSIIDLFSP